MKKKTVRATVEIQWMMVGGHIMDAEGGRKSCESGYMLWESEWANGFQMALFYYLFSGRKIDVCGSWVDRWFGLVGGDNFDIRQPKIK